MPTRAYIRLDPNVYDRKVLGVDEQGERIEGWRPYPADALVAFFGALALADSQSPRGVFRSRAILRELLRGSGAGVRYARHVRTLIERGDLVEKADGRLYIDGWDEWQEGDITVHERMRRMRARRSDRNGNGHGVTKPNVTDVTSSTVTSPSDGLRLAEAEAEAEATSRGGGGGPVTPANGASLSDEDRATLVARNRELLGDPTASESVRRAAAKALERLGIEAEAAPKPVPRPRRKPKDSDHASR